MSSQVQDKNSIGVLYKEGDFIDAKDNQGDWRVGYIIIKSPNTQLFKVRFDGWSSKYDQYFKFSSHKLKPFRAEIIGYTGQKLNPAVREGWTFTCEDLQQHTKRLQNFMSDPTVLSVHELNQLIRGHNYFYVDFLMTTKLPDVASLGLVMKYFNLNIEFLCRFLSLVEEQFGEFMKQIANRREMEEMTKTGAYYNSFYQIFDTIYIIFGNYERLEFFFKSNEEIMRQFFTIPAGKDHKKAYKQEVSKYLLPLKGLETISKILVNAAKNQQCVPFFFLSALTHLIDGIAGLFVAHYRETLLENLMKIGGANVKKLKESQIKELHRTDVSTFIEALISISKNTKYSETIEQWATMLELTLSLKMIECPFFQRKLKGISHIIEVFQRHEVAFAKNDQFRRWINSSNLFYILFQLNDNLQIVKKSCELTKFLVLRDLLRPEDVDIIWNSRIGKHETVVKQIYNLVGELPYYQKEVEKNLKLFKKVSSVAQEQWDQDYIHMIRQFSQNSYGFNTKQHMAQTFGFQMLYQYAISTEKEFAITEFVYLLNFFESSVFFTEFQHKCFLEIKSKRKVKTHIKILLLICKESIETFKQVDLPLNAIMVEHLLSNCDNKDKELIMESFQLLQGVVKSTSTELDIKLFNALWTAFIQSQNKMIFLGWLYKKKENGRIYLNSCLTDKIKKYLLLSLWKKEEQFRKIDEDQIVLIIQLFKYNNEISQKLRKPHPMIMVILTTELIGYNLLWNILKFVDDDRTAFLAGDFIAQIFNSYQEPIIEAAISFLTQNLMSEVKGALEQKNWTYLVRLLTLIKKAIDYDDEIYSIKYPTKHNFPKEYTVVRKDLNEEFVVKFSCTSIYYEFKKQLAHKMGLSMREFYLVSGKGVRLTRQHYYKTMIEPPMTGGKFQFVLREDKSILKISFNHHLDILFNLLDDNRIEKLVWSIVERLPISEELKTKVTNTQNILYELEHVGFYKELYMLRVMLELKDSWWLKLARGNSLMVVTSMLKKATFKTEIQQQYAIAVTNIIIKMLTISKLEAQIKIPEKFFSNFIPLLSQLLSIIEKEGSRNIESEQKIIKNVFEIAEIASAVQSVMTELVNSELSESLFNAALITIPLSQIRKKFADEFKLLLKYWTPESQYKIIHLLVGKLLTNAIDLKDKDNLKEYFTLTSHVLSKCSGASIESVYKKQTPKLVSQLFHLIRKEKSEESNEAVNKALEGYLTLLKHLISLEDQQIQRQIFNYLVNQCLFSEHDPKCKSSPARRESFSVLLELSENNQNIASILPYLTEMHKKGNWRSKRLEDWGISVNDKMKSSTGYVGLKNLGCICYMNSFNQQLFMTPYFRYSITNADDPSSANISPQQNVLYQVQKMFMNLEYSQKKYYNPKPFCQAFKDYEGNPTNVTEQMDIDEYSNVLFDRLESGLKNTQYSTLIKDMFGGVFSNQIVCKGCPHYSESEEPFLSISLTVKSKKNLYQSFQTMIKGDTLDGDNAYYCQRCSKKVTAVKRMSLKKLPNHLIITLKRFQFDYQKMIKLKINDYCEFPLNLNLKEYSQHYLRKQENSKALDEEEDLSSQYFNYVLKGFVVHTGYADSGHYYSFIQDRQTDKWYQFNDTVVRDFDIADLAEEAFGGQTSGYDSREKIKNAYMVIYQRQSAVFVGKQVPVQRQVIRRKESNQKIISDILRENKEQKLQSILFSRQYTRYLLGMLTKSDKLGLEIQQKILRYAIIFYLTITVREKNEGLNEFILKRINKGIEKHQELAQWTINHFSIQKIYDEYFLHNPFRQNRKTLCYWLVGIFKLCTLKVKTQFVNSLLNKVTLKSENYIDVCLMLYQISLSDKQMLSYLIKNNVLGRLITNITREKDKFKDPMPVELFQSEIGYEEQVQKTLLDEMRAKKLRLWQSENQYIWALAALIVQEASKAKTTLKQMLPELEYDSVELPELKIYKILEQAKNKHIIYSFTKFISHLTISNQEFLKEMITLVFNGLKEFQAKRYRQFMLLAEELMNIKDELLPLRFEALKRIVEALKFNEQYSSDSNILQQWLVILFNRNEHLRKYLQGDRQMLDYLYSVATKKVPSDDLAKKNKKYNDAMINKLHGVKFLCAKRGYTQLAEQMRDFYKGIINSTFQPSALWPSTFDNYLKSRHVGDKVAYFDSNDSLQYEEATIVSMSLGKIELSQGKNKNFSVWKDDQKMINEMPSDIGFEYSEGISQKLTDELEEEANYNLDQI